MEIEKSSEAGSRWLQGEDQQHKADTARQWYCTGRQKSGQQIPGEIGYSGCRLCGCRQHRAAECSVKGLERIKMEAVEQCRLWGIDGGKQRMLRVLQAAVDMVKGTRNKERERSYEQQARRAQSAKKAAGAAWAKVEALRRGEYPTPRSRVEAAKAQAAAKEAEAQWRAASAQREKARERQRWHREREVTARDWTEQRKAREAQGFALDARATAESAMKAAECARERADKKRAETAKAADAERKRAERATAADTKRKWSKVAGAAQATLQMRYLASIARVMVEAMLKRKWSKVAGAADAKRKQVEISKKKAQHVAERAKRWRAKAKTAMMMRVWSKVVEAAQAAEHKRIIVSHLSTLVSHSLVSHLSYPYYRRLYYR